MASPREILSKYIQIDDVIDGRYRVEELLGAGAYGVIYLAQDLVTLDEVAVKALPPKDESSSRTAHGRFQREMTIIRNLTHPHIITMYDFGETDDLVLFMVLEYLDGQTLEEITDGVPLEPAVAVTITRQIASALQTAHDKGVIHRDLKPANIMLVPDRRTKYSARVLDFGMAKLLSRIDDESIVQLTREGVAVGTPRYIAPEQARGLEVGPWTDLYALGLLVYEMFSGEQAVQANTIESAVHAHVSAKPLPLDRLERVPQTMRSILYRLLEKDPEQRYRDAAAVLRDLDALDLPAVGATRPAAHDRNPEADAPSDEDLPSTNVYQRDQADEVRAQVRREQERDDRPTTDEPGRDDDVFSGGDSPFGELVDPDSYFLQAEHNRSSDGVVSDEPSEPPERAAPRNQDPRQSARQRSERRRSETRGAAAHSYEELRRGDAPEPSLELDTEGYRPPAAEPRSAEPPMTDEAVEPPSAAEDEEQAEPDIADRLPDYERRRGPIFLAPRKTIQFIEMAASFALFACAFVALTAQFFSMDTLVRLAIGLAPPALSLMMVLFIRSQDWSWGFFRGLTITSTVALLAAHLISPEHLIYGLRYDAVWFLQPLVDTGVGSMVVDAVALLTDAYADLLAELLSS